MKKVADFLARDDDLIAQLADYTEKTAHTEALISAQSAPVSASANVQSALQGFSSSTGSIRKSTRRLPPTSRRWLYSER